MKRLLLCLLGLGCANLNGDMRLITASEKGDTELVKKLITDHIDINQQSKNGTALMWASTFGYTQIAKLLIDAHADVNAKNNIGITALMLAVEDRHIEIVKLLIDAGADIDMQDNQGRTAFGIASWKGYVDVVKLLLEKEKDPKNFNAQNKSGFTALMAASQKGHMEIVKFLIAAGANPNIQNTKDGNTIARDYAPGKAAYDAAVKEGFEKYQEYHTRKKIVNDSLAEITNLSNPWTDIIMDYACDPIDFAEEKVKNERPNACCAIQ